jgi:hypothetical protein
MTDQPTRAERLDRAVDAVLDGTTPGIAAASVGLDAIDHRLVRAAAALRGALAAPLIAPRFEARLGARLAGTAGPPWILRHPGRLIGTGAVGSAVGVGVTAYAVWRSSRRSGPAARLVHR